MDNAIQARNHWKFDATHPEQAEQLREAMREVVDPEIGMNIIELGLVREVSTQGNELHLKMILTTPFCPYGPALLEMARQKAEEITAIPAKIEMGMEAWDPGMMEDDTAAAWGLY